MFRWGVHSKGGFICMFTWILHIYAWMCACLPLFFFNVPCLLRLFSMFEELPERLSMELECVHWDRRDWGWGGSFRDIPPTSMQFTFMFGFSPAAHTNKKYFNVFIRCKSVLFFFIICFYPLTKSSQNLLEFFIDPRLGDDVGIHVVRIWKTLKVNPYVFLKEKWLWTDCVFSWAHSLMVHIMYVWIVGGHTVW